MYSCSFHHMPCAQRGAGTAHPFAVIALLLAACRRTAFEELAKTVAVLTKTLRTAGVHTMVNMDRALQVRFHECFHTHAQTG